MNLTPCFRDHKKQFFARLENVARGAPGPAYTIKMRVERCDATTRKLPKKRGTFAVNDLTLPWRAGFRCAAGRWRFAHTPCPFHGTGHLAMRRRLSRAALARPCLSTAW